MPIRSMRCSENGFHGQNSTENLIPCGIFFPQIQTFIILYHGKRKSHPPKAARQPQALSSLAIQGRGLKDARRAATINGGLKSGRNR